MRVGIITFHFAINYGAILQTYGLIDTIRRMGHEVHVIDHRPQALLWDRNYMKTRPSLRSLKTINGWKDWSKFALGFFPRKKKISKFDSFISKYFRLDSNSIDSQYDVIVCGSDQIWNPSIAGGMMDNSYWGIFPKGKTKKKVAYAASAGDIRNLKGYEIEAVSCWRAFDAISCRESRLTDYINEHFNFDKAITTLDPTLLAGKETFSGIASERQDINAYLLYFDLFNDNSIRKRAKEIANQKNLKFIEVSTYYEKVDGQKVIATASPEDFLSYLKHADFIITTSFHGTAFSLIFNRPFLTFEFEDSKNDRILNLLKITGLLSRFVKRDAPIDLSNGINWETVNNKLEKERKISFDFLNKALS